MHVFPACQRVLLVVLLVVMYLLARSKLAALITTIEPKNLCESSIAFDF